MVLDSSWFSHSFSGIWKAKAMALGELPDMMAPQSSALHICSACLFCFKGHYWQGETGEVKGFMVICSTQTIQKQAGNKQDSHFYLNTCECQWLILTLENFPCCRQSGRWKRDFLNAFITWNTLYLWWQLVFSPVWINLTNSFLHLWRACPLTRFMP